MELLIKGADEYVVTLVFTELGPVQFEGGFKMMEMAAKRKS